MKTGKQNRKSGFTLVEALISALIIAILVIGGSATMSYTGSNIQVTGNKRVALQIANQRLELAKANRYADIAPYEYDEKGKYYLRPDKNNPDLLNDTVIGGYENRTLDGTIYKMRTEVVRHSKRSEPLYFYAEYLEVIVTVQYGEALEEAVKLSTLILHPKATS